MNKGSAEHFNYIEKRFWDSMCRCCRYLDYKHNKGGVRRYCRVDGHKVKYGTKKCKDFEWD